MNILLLASHAVAEYDDVRMFTDLGYDVFAPGGYEVPSQSGEGIRPPLPDARHHPELVDRLNEVRRAYPDRPDLIDPGKARLHDDIIDWADVIIVHHFPEVWIAGQWDHIRHKRVIWRTCGQSDPRLERVMEAFRTYQSPVRAYKSLEIVRYSPAERRYFESVGSFAGEDALIRFGKYPEDYGPWTGEWPGVINITQDLYKRGDACGYGFWRDATAGLARWSEDGPPGPWALPIGKGSEEIGGIGAVSYPDMLDWLRRARVYLYTGTTPASYTLGLIEAMLSGIPVVSIGKDAWNGPSELFEGDEIAVTFRNDPIEARTFLLDCLDSGFYAGWGGAETRQRAIELFDVAKIGAQWREFLG